VEHDGAEGVLVKPAAGLDGGIPADEGTFGDTDGLGFFVEGAALIDLDRAGQLGSIEGGDLRITEWR
jgi:hypothetical protein